MPGRDAEEDLGGSARCATALLPMVQRANTDAQQPGKPALRQAKLFPRGGDALVPSRFLRAPKRFGINRAAGESALSIRAHLPNMGRRGRAARHFFLGLNHFFYAARFHHVTTNSGWTASHSISRNNSSSSIRPFRRFWKPWSSMKIICNDYTPLEHDVNGLPQV